MIRGGEIYLFFITRGITMKKTVALQVNENKKVELLFTLGTMRLIERELGYSLTSIFLTTNAQRIVEKGTTVDFVFANLKHAVVGGLTDEAVYDLMDEFIDNGYNLDMLGGAIISALQTTGVFIPKLVNKVTETSDKNTKK